MHCFALATSRQTTWPRLISLASGVAPVLAIIAAAAVIGAMIAIWVTPVWPP